MIATKELLLNYCEDLWIEKVNQKFSLPTSLRLILSPTEKAKKSNVGEADGLEERTFC